MVSSFDFDLSPAFMALIEGHDLRIVRTNKSFDEHTSHRECIGKTVPAAFPELVEAGIVARMRHVLETGESSIGRRIRLEFREPGSGAEPALPIVRYVNFALQPMREADGTLCGLCVHGVDITAEVEATESIRRHARAAELVLRHSRDLICTVNEGGRIVQASAASEQILGFRPSEIEGLRYMEFVHPDDRSLLHRMDRRLRGGGDVRPFTARFMNRVGGTVHMNLSLNWSDADGMLIAVGRDVTRDTIRDARYRTLVETAHDGIWLINASAETRFVNQRMADMLGCNTQDLAGRKVFEFVHPADRARMRARFEAREQGVHDTYEVRFKRQDGAVIWCRVAASPHYNENGEYDGALGMVADISDTKRAEAELRRAKEQAEDLARLKSSILSNMSHELRTPLTSIIGYADVLVDESTGNTHELARIIRQGGKRLQSTLDSVLAMAQIESGSTQLRFSEIDIASCIRDVVALHAVDAEEKGLTLRLGEGAGDDDPDATTSGGLIAVADEGAVMRVLTNLVANAIKFTTSGEVVVSAGVASTRIWCKVTDTGVGISPDFLPHVFDEFRQESHGLSREHVGVGLGLSICRRLVDLMRGEITVESTLNTGTTFTVHLPAAMFTPGGGRREPGIGSRGHPDADASPPRSSPSGTGFRITM